MSGLIFPFDFMPSFMAKAGQLTPLSQGIIGMQSVINYSIPSAAALWNLLIYVFILNILAILAIRIKMR